MRSCDNCENNFSILQFFTELALLFHELFFFDGLDNVAFCLLVMLSIRSFSYYFGNTT